MVNWKIELAEFLEDLGTMEKRLDNKPVSFRNLDELIYKLRKGEPVLTPLGDDPRDPKNISIDELEIGTRAIAALKMAKCETISDVLLLGRSRLRQVPYCGMKSINEITASLKRFGYGF